MNSITLIWCLLFYFVCAIVLLLLCGAIYYLAEEHININFIHQLTKEKPMNKYAVVKRGTGVWFAKHEEMPEQMNVREALEFAAYIVSVIDPSGNAFSQILRQVRAESENRK